jgi:hypothetical protein
MIISVNGFVLNDPTNPNQVYLDEPVGGLSLPPIRTSSSNYSGRDGGYVGSQFYGMRLISLTGYIFATSAANLWTIRKAFETAVAAPSVTLNISTDDGGQYLINGYLDALDIPISRTTTKAPYNLTIIAADPVIYDNSAAGSPSVILGRQAGGGITWPITWPITWVGGTGLTTIINPGNVTLYPIITLTDQMTNPIITNTTTGQSFSLSGLVTTTGAVVVIDMNNRTVLLNGGSILPYLTTASSWIALIPGSNSLILNTSNSGDTVAGTVSWKTGYRGI